MPYPATPTFWLEPTGRAQVGLRRYSVGEGFTCETGHHQFLSLTGEELVTFTGEADRRTLAHRPDTPHDDPRWPTHCTCGYEFTADDHWQDWQELIYRRTDTGDRHTLQTRQVAESGGVPPAPPGAAWDAWWMPQNWRGPDGIALMVRCPNNRDWHVDGQASNCTRPGQPHYCWIRHGDPRQANLTVDKNGNTCAAGGGSIQAGDYHGFLTGGVLTAG